MSAPFKLNRRQILGMAGGCLVTAAGPGIWTPTAVGKPKRRRHLINIQAIDSGMDTAWSTSPMLDMEAQGISAELRNTHLWGRVLNKARFPDSEALSHAGSYFGPVMKLYSADNLDDLSIWRGLNPAGGHVGGNRINQTGHMSPYAAAFSVILADTLASTPDYPRPLHYVQIAANPASFTSQVGFYEGVALPININDNTVWSSLSNQGSTDPVAKNPAIRQHFETFINKISHNRKFKLPGSEIRYTNNYYKNFEGTQELLTQNFSQSTLFLGIWERYKNAVVADFNRVFLNSPSMVEAMTYFNGFTNNSANTKGFLENYAGLTNSTFAFAMAEFLVTQDLAAVVDLPTKSFDGHASNATDLLYGFFTQSCINQLMTSLRSFALEDGSGGNLLGQTLIVSTTEFDRWIARGEFGSNNTLRSVGTDHGQTMTVQMAGYGARPGIFGARMGGPGGSLSGVTGIGFAEPVPINDQGSPASNGRIYDNFSLLPTILNIFEVAVPPQQVSDARAFHGIKKPGFKA